MKTKTFLPVFLAAVMVFSLCGCGGSVSIASEVSAPASTTTTTGETTTTTAITTTTAEETTTITVKQTTTTKKPTTTTKATMPTKATTTKPAKKSWFDERGFKITPLTQDLCFCKDADHTCADDEVFGIVEGEKDALGNVVSLPEGYKNVEYYAFGYSQNVQCAPGRFSKRLVAFDRYTGTVINALCLTDDGWQRYPVKLVVNGKGISVTWTGDGGTVYAYINSVICPTDYDGIVFAYADEWLSYGWTEYDGKTHTIDEYIDFDTAEYYFFSASNK